jgi:hypothetical protein
MQQTASAPPDAAIDAIAVLQEAGATAAAEIPPTTDGYRRRAALLREIAEDAGSMACALAVVVRRSALS